MAFQQPRRNDYRQHRQPQRGNPEGYEIALEHIRQAEELTKELGGTDHDVKAYFFSLPPDKMREVLNCYEEEYGFKARSYAEQALPKWHSGSVKMSGMVAERLFSLLPPLMPIEQKYKLAESLWRHVALSSHCQLYFGPDVDSDELSQVVKLHFEEKAAPHQIPNSVQKRFNWLASGDISVKQQLLNHFIERERELVAQAVREKTAILMENLRHKGKSDFFNANMTLEVGKHTLQLRFCEHVEGISDNLPPKKSAGFDNWLMYAGFAAIILFWIMSNM